MNELEMLRTQIDALDEIIAKAYAKRLEVVHKIGEYKKNNNVAVLDCGREQKVFDKVGCFGGEYQNEVKDLYAFIMNYSKILQQQK